MKVKEIPVSLYNQLRLSYASSSKLIRAKDTIPVIVSLASIPSRLSIVHLTIKSILNQEVLPNKIILWLHEDLKSTIPRQLAKLEGKIFSIKYSDYKSSHRKLVDTLQIFDDAIVITCDDDMMYRKDWLPKLYQQHLESPRAIIGNQSRCISYKDGQLLPYKSWPFGKDCKRPDALLPIGAGGTLYPIGAFDQTVFDRELFLKLTPKADDLWFKAMGLLNGTKSIKASNTGKEPIPIWGSQRVSLKKSNITEDKNRTQWEALTSHFDIKPERFD